MRELPRTAPHEGLWVVYALRAAFAGTGSSSMPLVKLIPRVDVINTFRVVAGHFECFRVVSRSQIQRFRSSARGFDSRQLHRRAVEMRPFFFGGLYDHRAAGLSNRRSAKPDPGGRLSVKMQICVIQRKHGHELAWAS